MIEVQNMSKDFGTENQITSVLKNISLFIKAGDFCALTGASGSGKTTLMNILGLLDRPSSGSIVIDNCEIEKLSDIEAAHFRNHTIGFVFQSFHLLPSMTALENVALPLLYRGQSRQQRQEKAKQFLERVGLKHRLHYKPDELSGGQKQRVAIARALITSPKLVLADEPTGNLDSHSAADILKLFQELNTELNTTVLIVTHDIQVAKTCRSQIIIKDGQILKQKGSMQ